MGDVLGESGCPPGVSGDVPVEAVDSSGIFVGVPGILECVPNLEYSTSRSYYQALNAPVHSRKECSRGILNVHVPG